jgi:hypothetical protein
MKELSKKIVFFLFTGFIFLVNSCDKVNDFIPVPSMAATVDGESWTSIFRYSVLYQSNAMFMITGTPEATEEVDKAIVLSIYGTEPGTYELIPGTLTTNCLVVYKKTAGAVDGSDNYYISSIASITISKIDTEKKHISGTFSASLFPSNNPVGTEIIITNGKFENLTYQEEP